MIPDSSAQLNMNVNKTKAHVRLCSNSIIDPRVFVVEKHNLYTKEGLLRAEDMENVKYIK